MSRLTGVATISYYNNKKEIDQGLPAILDIWKLLIDRAGLDQPDIILLPEHFAFSGLTYKVQDVAEYLPQGGPVTDFLKRRARAQKAYIFASYCRKSKAGDIYNSAVLFDRQGRIAGVYDKTFPTIGEMENGIRPGKGAVVLETDFGRIGAGICFDFNFRELFAEYRRKQIDLLCFLSAFPAGFQIPIMAYENQMHIASAICGPQGVIVDPLGRVLEKATMHAQVIFRKINLDCRVLHIDYNNANDKIHALKAKYKHQVQVDVSGPEAVYLVTSLHPKKSINDMIREFKLETVDDYFNRSRAMRRKFLSK